MSIKKSVAKATALGVFGAIEHTATTTGYMHRSYTHSQFELTPPLKLIARASIWKTGVKARVWATIHREHHDFADVQGDPHSPLQQGWSNVLKNNHNYYRQRAKQIGTNNLPADLQPDALDKAVFDKTAIGLAAGFVVDAGLNKLAGNKLRYTPITTAVRLVGYVAAGNFVNTFGHLGADPRSALFRNEYTPHQDGTYGSDSRIIAALTLGEGYQKVHHDSPQSINFSGDRKGLERALDPIGFTLEALSHTPLVKINDK